MIPSIVEDVMLSRSPRVAKVCRRQQWNCLIVENNDKEEVGEEDITRLRGITCFDIIKQMQHLCGVAFV